MKESSLDVILILKQHENNITARRWLKDPAAIERILKFHQDWNYDHEKIGKPEMIFTLEENVDDYLSHPQKIDDYMK